MGGLVCASLRCICLTMGAAFMIAESFVSKESV